jgi:hypothetical protein
MERFSGERWRGGGRRERRARGRRGGFEPSKRQTKGICILRPGEKEWTELYQPISGRFIFLIRKVPHSHLHVPIPITHRYYHLWLLVYCFPQCPHLLLRRHGECVFGSTTPFLAGVSFPKQLFAAQIGQVPLFIFDIGGLVCYTFDNWGLFAKKKTMQKILVKKEREETSSGKTHRRTTK